GRRTPGRLRYLWKVVRPMPPSRMRCSSALHFHFSIRLKKKVSATRPASGEWTLAWAGWAMAASMGDLLLLLLTATLVHIRTNKQGSVHKRTVRLAPEW